MNKFVEKYEKRIILIVCIYLVLSLFISSVNIDTRLVEMYYLRTIETVSNPVSGLFTNFGLNGFYRLNFIFVPCIVLAITIFILCGVVFQEKLKYRRFLIYAITCFLIATLFIMSGIIFKTVNGFKLYSSNQYPNSISIDISKYEGMTIVNREGSTVKASLANKFILMPSLFSEISCGLFLVFAFITFYLYMKNVKF